MENTNTIQLNKIVYFKKYQTLSNLERNMIGMILDNIDAWRFDPEVYKLYKTDKLLHREFSALENYTYGLYDGFCYLVDAKKSIEEIKRLTRGMDSYKKLSQLYKAINQVERLNDEIAERVEFNPSLELNRNEASAQNF
tara:strand:+ start:162 stop:578 length:417 start_codon:yes stop_codon:yes gene_type:complete